MLLIKLTPTSGKKPIISQTNLHDLVIEKKILLYFEDKGVETHSLVESLEGTSYFVKFSQITYSAE
jgi:hypothetical protein